ncbi:MAG: PKD domain-containing protein [Bacteroidota bacterium]
MQKNSFLFIVKCIFCSLFCLGSFTPASGTHIVGGELYYKYLGGDQYEITLIVYRDCFFGVPPFDDPASIGVFDNPFNNLIQQLLLSPLDSVLLPPSITSPCFIPPVNICYRQATYRTTITLPANGSGYWLVYQRCCRNNSILNIVHPEERGATYTAFIPGTSTFSQNSNPRFTYLPPTFVCLGIPFTFDHSAIDFENDSIVYELCTPLDFNSPGNPLPQPPDPPPYSDVPWQVPFSLSNILGGTPMAIDPVSGILTCTPNTQGQFVFGVCANEFRNGIYLSTTRRDFQVNVVPCNTIVVAALQNPILNCDDNSVTFVNQSQNAASYFWNFGDTATLADTSHLFSPTYLYPDTGIYNVQLVAYSGIQPACNDTVTGTVYVYPGYSAAASVFTTPCSPVVQFTDTTFSSYSTVHWDWNFGDGVTDTTHNPVHIYSAPGFYTAHLTLTSDKGCTDTVTLTVPLNFVSATIASSLPARCKGECNGQALASYITGVAPFSYQWSDPALQTTALAVNLCAGNYVVTVTDSSGCVSAAPVLITEPDTLDLIVSAINDYCNHACVCYAIADADGGNGGYIYLWNDPANQSERIATSLCAGDYTIVVTDSKGCIDSAGIQVPYLDSLPSVIATASAYTIYEGQSTNLFSTHSSVYIYNWTPSVTLSESTIPDPLSTPPQTTQYLVEVTDSNGCKVRDTVLIRVIEVTCKEPEIFVPNAFTPNDNNENDVLLVRGNTIETLYFAVYDRWGEKVFETENQNKGWDGIYNGAKVAPGVFVYYMKAVCYDKSELILKGNITVIR